YNTLIKGLKDWEKAALERALEEEQYIYFVDFENVGGLVMPIPLRIANEDGSHDSIMIPAEIWRRNHKKVTKMLIRDQAMQSVELDAHHEIADADYSNNRFPSRIQRSRLELYKSDPKKKDLMADMLEKLRPVKGGEDSDEKDVPLKIADE
ncbi:MAG: aminopeptidase, partial [Opitutales bacterium]